MQVTQVDAHVTHAVIGGQKAMAFGISDDPEFFVMLSNTLYSDKFLAVIRETLCNAWDAHIEAGCTKKPVQITLTDQTLVIRDFGRGIPHDKMQQVYCVYGKSTKKNDGKQTGGFGLGCKAPWAYADHFEVTSWNGGVKTIYRASKASAEADGKPALVPLVTLPCDETGLQVSMDVKGHSDRIQFQNLIARIAKIGEMNIELNGVKLQTMPFSDAKHDFLITEETLSTGSEYHKIWVRYGNVVYPIENHPEYKAYYDEVGTMLGWLQTNRHHATWKIVLMAQPHTISVTPSRESLSMTDFTIGTLKGLLEDFCELARKHLEAKVYEQATLRIKEAVEDMQPYRLLDTGLTLPLTRRRIAEAGHNGYLTDVEQISHAYVRRQYPNFKAFRRWDINLRLRTLIEFGFNRGLTQSLLAAYEKEIKLPNQMRLANWLQRRVIAPLIMELKAAEHMDPARLWIYGRNDADDRRSRYGEEKMFHEAVKFAKDDLEACLPFLRNIVVLTHNRIDVEERVNRFPAMKQWFGNVKDSLVYVVQRSDPKIKAARALFKQLGYYVIDLTMRQTWEPAPFKAIAAEKKEWKPRPKGLPKVSVLIPAARLEVNWYTIRGEDAEVEAADRIEQPEFLVQAQKADMKCFDGFDTSGTLDVVRLFGDKGGVVVNSTQADKYRDAGAIDLLPYLLEKVPEEIRTNPRIQRFLTVDPKAESSEKGPLSYNGQQLLELISGDEVLKVYFNIEHEMTREDRRYLHIWRQIENRYTSRHRYAGAVPKEVKDFSEEMKKITYSKEMVGLIQTLVKSSLVGMVDHSGLQKVLGRTADNETIRQQKARARDLLIYAIKG